jgi:hypothetical protein
MIIGFMGAVNLILAQNYSNGTVCIGYNYIDNVMRRLFSYDFLVIIISFLELKLKYK